MALTTQFVRLKIGTNYICIKSFPDIDPHGNPDQVETTTLCSQYHEYVNGLKNYADDLEFVANYEEALFNTLNVLGDAQDNAIEVLLCDSTETGETGHEYVGKNGKFAMTGEVAVRLNGGGVGDVMEMTIVIKPKSEITFSQVS